MRKFSMSLGVAAVLSCVFAAGCGDPPPRPSFNAPSRIPAGAIVVECGDLALMNRVVRCDLPANLGWTDPYVCNGAASCTTPSTPARSFTANVTFRSAVTRSGQEDCVMSESGLMAGDHGQFGMSNVYLYSAYTSDNTKVTLELMLGGYKWYDATCSFAQ